MLAGTRFSTVHACSPLSTRKNEKQVDLIGNAVTDSEEIVIDEGEKYVAVFDPLDGSSNLDAGIPTGTIIGVRRNRCCDRNSNSSVGGSRIHTSLHSYSPHYIFLSACSKCMFPRSMSTTSAVRLTTIALMKKIVPSKKHNVWPIRSNLEPTLLLQHTACIRHPHS